MAELTSEAIEHALRTARRLGLDDVSLSIGDHRFEGRLAPAPKAVSTAAVQPAGLDSLPKLAPLKATLVGYYSDEKVSLKVGQTLSKGDVVGSVTALGIATEVESNVSGEIMEILVKGGDAVEYGQALAMVKTTA